MSLFSQIPKPILTAISDPSLDVAAAAADASELILSAAFAPANKEEATLDIITAVAMLFAHGLRLSLDARLFAELLSGTVLASDRAASLAEAYAALLSATASSSAATVSQQALHRLIDGPLRRVTGMEWSMGHKLGNRALDPPERSVPVFYFKFTVSDSDKTIDVTATQEQAQELLAAFRDMVKEGERLV